MADRRRTKRKEYRFADFVGIQEFTAPTRISDEYSPFSKNCDTSIPGALKKAFGYTQVGSDTGTDVVRGLYTFEKEDGTSELVKLVGTNLQKYSASAWSTITSGSGFGTGTGRKSEGVNGFIDDEERLYVTDEHSSLLTYYNGTAAYTVANTYAKHIEYWNYRLYLGNVKLTSTVYPYRVQFTPEGSDTLDTTNDYFDDMGQPITAMKVYGKKLYLWTDDFMASYDGYRLERVIGNYGTPSADSVVVARGRLFWYNRFGFWMYGGTGLPTLISRPVQGFVDAITAPASVSGGIDSKERVVWYIGDVTYKSTAYSDGVLRYDIDNNGWEFEDARPWGRFTTEKSGGDILAYAGDVDSLKVWKLDNGYTNNGSAIASEWQTRRFDADRSWDLKNFYKVRLVYKPSNQSEYITVKYRLDGASSWSQIEGTANNIPLTGTDLIKVVELSLPTQTQGRWIQFQLTHSSSAGGFEIYDIQFEFDMVVH